MNKFYRVEDTSVNIFGYLILSILLWVMFIMGVVLIACNLDSSEMIALGVFSLIVSGAAEGIIIYVFIRKVLSEYRYFMCTHHGKEAMGTVKDKEVDKLRYGARCYLYVEYTGEDGNLHLSRITVSPENYGVDKDSQTKILVYKNYAGIQETF